MKFINNLKKISTGKIIMFLGVIGMVSLLATTNISPIAKTFGFCFFFLVLLFAIFLESPILERLKLTEEETSQFED